MSALVFFGNVVTGARSARGARAWLLALLTLLVPERGVRAGGQQHRLDDGVERDLRADHRQIRAEERAGQSPAGFAIATPPRIALDFLDTGNGLGTTQRVRRGRRAPQRQRDPGGQPDPRRVQSQPAADLRNAGRGQRRAR